MDSKQLRKKLIQIVEKENGRLIPPNILVRKLLEKDSDVQKQRVYNMISELILDGTFFQNHAQKIGIGYSDYELEHEIFEGKISITQQGHGFIRTLDEENPQEFFVNKKYVNGALKKDLVKFVKLKKEPKDGIFDAAVIEVVGHEKNYYVGEYVTIPNGYYVKVDDPLFYLNVKLEKNDGLVNGHKILFEITKSDNKDAYAKLIQIIGHRNDVGSDILSIVYDNGIDPIIDPQVVDAAAKCSFFVDVHQQKIRRFITDREIVSIDPVGSKDIDDTVYVKKLNEDRYFLGVSIADVSFYVQPDSILDKDASKRGTSTYLVDRVIPMLPHNISNNICSLNEGEERMSITCDMIVDKSGKIVWQDVYPAVVKSHKQMSYDEVNQYYENKNRLDYIPISIKEMLKEAKELHHILRRKKENDGYVDFDIKEPKIKIDENGVPIDIYVYERGVAQMMIEDFMIAANEAVVLFVENLKNQNHKQEDKSIQKRVDLMPFIYRTHDQPSIQNLEKFEIEAKKMTFKITHDFQNIKPNTISSWLKNNNQHPSLPIISKILLRTMSKAMYSPNNTGHFGLASNHYTHFTSPIRRYPDLIVHRILWMFYFDPQSYTDKQREDLAHSIKLIADESNNNEAIAVKTERDVNAAKFAEYMSFRIGSIFSGTVTSVLNFGAFVELDNTVEGLIRMKNFKNDFYTFIAQNNTLVGQKTNKIITIGTKVKVKVIEASKSTKKIDFELVEFI